MNQPRQYAAIDIAKYIGALLVVAIHTCPFADLSASFSLFFNSTVARLAVPFFFIASSYFLFRPAPGKKKAGPALVRYLRRLIVLYLVWTVIYLPYTIWNYSQAGFSILSLFAWIRDFFLNGSYYHLWFLPALIWGTLIVSVLMKKKGLRKTLLISLVLYLIGYLINIYAPLWQSLPGISVVYGFFTKTLVTARDGFFFAPVFVSLGALAARARPFSLKFSAAGFGVSFVCLILEVTLYAKIGMLQDLSSMFISLVPASYFLLEMLLQVKIPWKPSYRELRRDSILIYTSHILFARVLLTLLPNAHLVVYLATLACAQLFGYIVVKESRRFAWLKLLY